MNRTDITITTRSSTETIELGKKIGAALHGGEVIALVGQLGAGKTHLIKGIAAGLEARQSQPVSSPTFVLVNEYFGRGGHVHIYHIDAYRVESLREFEALGFEEYCRPDSVVMVEWADKVMSVVEEFAPIRIELEHAGKTRRKLKLSHLPPYLADTLTHKP
ncbi:MAG: tRNA (adenosine(37)-N6)-threonylcarbamoyltransferase complex ATPase subunit type 1 TsaE [Planctomycetaceae bacterium]|nr:tRNA (adenosine(37)-N6)-threonylcarbamoyltransferase complex ATPase subunit type 1 TsaE [Planctomycetaceae bacterium]